MTLQPFGSAQRRSRGPFSVGDRLRARLADGMGMWKRQLVHDMSILDLLTANPEEDPTGVERATTALQMYRAVEAIEEFEDALLRLEEGRYGICQSCGRAIPIERLQVFPPARSCATCPTAADRRPHSRRRRGRLEHRDGRPPGVNRLAIGGQLSIRERSPRAQPAIRHRSATSMCSRTRHCDESQCRTD